MTMHARQRIKRVFAALTIYAASTSGLFAMGGEPFGDAKSTAFAKKLWAVMVEARLAGPDRIIAYPYKGQPPHGAILSTLDTRVSVDGREGWLIVKRNFGPAEVTVKQVAGAPRDHLSEITVMFQREAGYDEKNRNWFWAKYEPDGSLDSNKKGIPLAGQVAKGTHTGCIACHRAAPGGDLIFSFDRPG